MYLADFKEIHSKYNVDRSNVATAAEFWVWLWTIENYKMELAYKKTKEERDDFFEQWWDDYRGSGLTIADYNDLWDNEEGERPCFDEDFMYGTGLYHTGYSVEPRA